jgi:hypothetical protein
MSMPIEGEHIRVAPNASWHASTESATNIQPLLVPWRLRTESLVRISEMTQFLSTSFAIWFLAGRDFGRHVPIG